MNLVDILILVVLLFFLVKGALRGLLREVCSLIGLLLGGFLAFRYQGPLAETIMDVLDWPAQVCVVIAFLLLFFSCVALFAVLGFLLSRFVKMVFLGGLNRVTGAFFGLVQGVLLLAIIMFALSLRPLPWGLTPVFKASQLAPPLVTLGEATMRGSRALLQKG
ncbi:membrane protein required for colicin V production [Geothermobacter ehrlichii]|uniref:Membrane protein required for colicin V production n=1 Tax=Geothermobacter ehrlichii TaxID=213224 RepID=A0A5D3WJ31_9BACT|nr:CvpA family protein [Geothermobacter ehrlichii]TYO98510.1 membrane protein required for colicin V production [Geothermobacter ehrlichii]